MRCRKLPSTPALVHRDVVVNVPLDLGRQYSLEDLRKAVEKTDRAVAVVGGRAFRDRNDSGEFRFVRQTSSDPFVEGGEDRRGDDSILDETFQVSVACSVVSG